MILCISHSQDARNVVLKGIVRRIGPIYYCKEENPTKTKTWIKVDDDVKIDNISDLDQVQNVIESLPGQETHTRCRWLHIGGLL